jgi:aspartyl-tRNA synthetase
VFYSSQRHTIDQRRVELVLRDDEHEGAPPHAGVDLAVRRVVIMLAPRRPTEA